MAELKQDCSDNMFYDENIYHPEVRLGEDGFYRWRYDLDKYHDGKIYRFLLKFFAIFSLAGAVLEALLARVPVDVIRQDPSQYQTMLTQHRLLYALLGYAAFFIAGLLIAGLVRLLSGGASTWWYRMNDEFIQIQPSGRTSGITRFVEVKQAELFPEINEIRLISRWGKCPVLVRREDYAQIKDHILAHLPQNTEIKAETKDF